MSLLDASTRLVRGGDVAGEPHGATSPPLYQTSTFRQSSATEFGAFDYTRTDNPTRQATEAVLADLEGGTSALCFASGMAAIAATLRLARPGERILCGRDLYGGTQRFAHTHLPGVDVEHVDLSSDADGRVPALEAALARGGVRLVFAETPSNPRLEIVDLRAIAAATRAADARLVVDGTAMTPWLQAPLELGADVVVHSATKGLAGHGDVTAGVVATCDDALRNELFARRNAEGSALAPFEAWLLLRGLRTLGVRVDHAQETAEAVACALAADGRVNRVLYPGLAAHPGAVVHASQTRPERERSGGVVISLELPSALAARRLVDGTRLFSTSVSFGGTASSISIPHFMSHASVPDGAAPRPDATLVRLSIGLEAARDLLADLDAALDPGGERHLEAGLIRPRAARR